MNNYITSKDELYESDTLEHLYNINKHAKKYKELGSENYKKGNKTTAKANSLKKKALYKIKENILKQIYLYSEKIEVHTINNNDFYFIKYNNNYSFHTPIDTVCIKESNIECRKTLHNFNSGSTKEKTNKSLKSSLQFFNNKFNENANEYLEMTHLSYGYNSYFIGWNYL